MNDLFGDDALPPVPLRDQIACVDRELAMRRQVYPRWVAGGRMPQAKADEEIRRMAAVLTTLKEVGAERQKPAPLGEAHNSGDGVYRP